MSMKPIDVICSALYCEEQDVVPIECSARGISKSDEGILTEGALDKTGFDKHLALIRYLGNSIVNTPIGFGGIGMERVAGNDDHAVFRTDFGSLIYIRDPYKRPDGVNIETLTARRTISQAVRWPEDLEHVEVPEPDPSRFEAAIKFVNFFKKQGYFVNASMKGVFDSPWYYLRDFIPWLKDLKTNKAFAKKLIPLAMTPQVENIKIIVEAGADQVTLTDDMGASDMPFISPEIYKEFIYPWHRRIVNTFHKMGAFVNLHCHGQINPLMPYIAEAGFDAMNPFEPEDRMNLAEIKEKYGDKMMIQAATSWRTNYMSLEEVKEHVLDRIRQGAPGGGFILSASFSSGGSGTMRTQKEEEDFVTLIKKIRSSYAKYPLRQKQ